MNRENSVWWFVAWISDFSQVTNTICKPRYHGCILVEVWSGEQRLVAIGITVGWNCGVWNRKCPRLLHYIQFSTNKMPGNWNRSSEIPIRTWDFAQCGRDRVFRRIVVRINFHNSIGFDRFLATFNFLKWIWSAELREIFPKSDFDLPRFLCTRYDVSSKIGTHWQIRTFFRGETATFGKKEIKTSTQNRPVSWNKSVSWPCFALPISSSCPPRIWKECSNNILLFRGCSQLQKQIARHSVFGSPRVFAVQGRD